ncbi:MAG: restriction endonuclease subunit S [Candidatus Aureabacteria bacterium]|nr:restriction endonuclease subunit S [Candidatus Auribacterota bacterium]
MGTPIITVEHLGENRIVHRDLPRVSEKDRNRLSRYSLQPGDIVFSRVGSVDLRALVREKESGWLFSGRLLRVRPKRNVVDPGYLSWFFGLPSFREYVRSIAFGATMPSLNTKLLSDLQVYFPPMTEQKAIAHILGTLDNKIELNRRMNETLESMARAIFKSWFVGFDPVHAKAESRDPALPKHIAELFPDRFEDSELGEIPKGWRVGTLGEVAEHPRRGVQPDQIEPDTSYIALEHMPRRCIALSNWGNAEALESNKFRFKTGEILFGKLRPYFHKVGVAPMDGVCSTDIVVVAPRSSHWFGFVLGHVSSVPFVEYTNASSTGTKMPRTSWSDMGRYQVVIPPKPLAESFTNQIRPTVDCIISSIQESHTLAALRDVLLPRLLSGEIRVKDAEIIMEKRI